MKKTRARTPLNENKIAANGVAAQHNVYTGTRQFRIDPGQLAQIQIIETSDQVKQLRNYQAMADRFTSAVPQLKEKKENRTGLPDQLKSGIENLSGHSMSDVNVHFNSSRPAQLNAHAYAQGTQIHIAPGQEKHLAHEAWHVVQQKQGRVKSVGQLKSAVQVNADPALEKEADFMGAKALQMKAAFPSPGGKISTFSDTVIQLRVIANVASLKSGLITALDKGEKTGGSSDKMISGKADNVTKLTALYTPGHSDEATQNSHFSKVAAGNWREGWYDRVDRRIEEGARTSTRAVIFWEKDIERCMKAEEVNVSSFELLGEELHDKGLGPAKVTFDIELHHNPLIAVSRSYVVKPEDRSVEKAILGSGDSIATRLNTHVGKGRKVATLDMKTSKEHGTIMEYVGMNLKSIGESALRKIHFWDSSRTVTVETIAFAFLAGLYDLHDKNVITKGGAPVLIDADVAVRPKEYEGGPSNQAGFSPGATKEVQNQLKGNKSAASQILQYAIDHPDEVTAMIKKMIGGRVSRIVPLHTSSLALGLQLFILDMQANNIVQANQGITKLANDLKNGDKLGSPGLEKELGQSRGKWNQPLIENEIKKDFDKGVIPHFQYQAQSGQVFFHGQVIWMGKTLNMSMAVLKTKLKKG